MTIARAIFGALLALLLLGQPGVANTRPGFALAEIGASSPLRAQEKNGEKSCRSGKNTRQFGWKVVAFGVSTLKYLVGLLIIPVGLFLVCIGAVLEAVEWVAC